MLFEGGDSDVGGAGGVAEYFHGYKRSAVDNHLGEGLVDFATIEHALEGFAVRWAGEEGVVLVVGIAAAEFVEICTVLADDGGCTAEAFPVAAEVVLLGESGCVGLDKSLSMARGYKAKAQHQE